MTSKGFCVIIETQKKGVIKMSTKIITEFQIDGFNLRYNEYYSYVQYAKSNNKITVLDWGEIPFNSFSKEEQKKVLKELKSWIKILDK